jgi:hypothetical protein
MPSSITSRLTVRRPLLLDDRIEEQVEGLLQFPEMGRIGRIEGT